jgi:hypothetical protein
MEAMDERNSPSWQMWLSRNPLSADMATAAVLRDDPNGTLRNDPRCPQLDQIEFALTKPRRGHL